jgi:hypothetical protein
LERGSILHFRDYDSAISKDNSSIDIIDEDEILIHAFEKVVTLQSFGGISLSSKPFKFFRWKDL